jgi:aminomethyltransferase
MITNAGDHLYLVVNGAVKHQDIEYLTANLPTDLQLVHDEHAALLALQGPKAAAVLARLVPDAAALFFMEAGAFDWNGVALWISRSGYTGEDGFEISVAAQHVAALADALCGEPQVKPIGLGARDSLRLEAGLPLYGHDMDPSTDPVEANASFAVSKRRREEGGFRGATRILAALTDGPARKLVGFAIDGRLPVREGAPIFADEAQVGAVTSGGFGPSVGAPIAMGYVTSERAAPGTALSAEVRGKRIAIHVAPMPFVPHHYHRRGKAL